ncbi:MAG: dTMP kinase [Gammaproteobacteria bacterium]|nr:dTMP kinase [Gammaproteobacteria bacterium]
MNQQRQGCLITVEGIEGAGKSSHIEHLRERLTEAGKSVVVTREPGGTTLGEEIRGLLLSHREGGMDADAELLLIFAARAEHLERVIRPALAAGQWVVCDRFTEASYAYQGAGRGMGMDRVGVLEEWLQGAFRPDLTLLFDLPVEIGMGRIAKRADQGGGDIDRFEQEHLSFWERVRGGYLELARRHPDRFRLIDAAPPIEAVRAQVDEAVTAWLKDL